MAESPYDVLCREEREKLDVHMKAIDGIKVEYRHKIASLQKQCPHRYPDGTSADDGGFFVGNCSICGYCFG